MISLNLFGIPGLLIKELKQQIAKRTFSSLYSWLFKCVNSESKTILFKKQMKLNEKVKKLLHINSGYFTHFF